MIRLRRNADGGTAALSEAGVEILHRNDAAKVLAYRRFGSTPDDEVIVVVNLMNKAYASYDIGVAQGAPWQVRLDTDSKTFGADFGGGSSGRLTPTAHAKDGKPFTLSMRLAPYSAIVLSRAYR
jgi:1,4-alpha-glucan branching enzyme